MNKIIYSIGILLVLFLFAGCEKEDTLGLSKQTNYVVLTMAGDELMFVDKGAAFTDPGVTGTEAGEAAEVVVTGTVDTSTGGIYILTYTSINVDGYPASLVRYVVVIDKVAAATVDLAGQYERTYYGGPKEGTYSDWTKVEDWKYTVNDPGGVDNADHDAINLTIYLVDATHFVVPIQENPLGGTIFCSSTKGGVVPDVIEHTGLKYLWSVKGAGFGTNLRTLEKR